MIALNLGSMSSLERAAVRRFFDRASGHYGDAAVLQAQVREELLDRLRLIAVEPEVVVDLGSGPGMAARALAKAFPRAEVIAADIAPGMLRAARRHAGLLRTFHRVAADACRIPLKSGSVGLVFSNLMLQWCESQDRVFEEVQRILKPGGFFAFSTFGPQTLWELRAAWAAVDANPHVHDFVDIHDLGSALSRAGFQEPVLDIDRVIRRYHDPGVLMRELQSIGARNASSARARGLTGRDKFRRMLAAYDAESPRGNAGDPAYSVSATFEIIYGAAWAAQAPRGEFAVHAGSLRVRQRP